MQLMISKFIPQNPNKFNLKCFYNSIMNYGHLKAFNTQMHWKLDIILDLGEIETYCLVKQTFWLWWVQEI